MAGIAFEDRVDISNSAPPGRVQSPQAMVANMNRTVKARSRPQQQSGQKDQGNPLQALESTAQNVGKEVGQGIDTAGQFLAGQGFSTAKPTLNPIDWAKQDLQDAGVVWGYARDAYKILSGGYHDGVNNVYKGNDAKSWLLQQGSGLLASGIPTVGLQESGANLLGNLQEAKQDPAALVQGESEQERQARLKRMQQNQEAAVQDAPGRAVDVATFMVPGGKAAQMGAQVVLPFVQEMLSGDPSQEDSALFWLAAGTLMTFAHIPEPVRKLLRNRFAKWGDVEQAIQEAVDSKKEGDRGSVDLVRQSKNTKSWIDRQLEHGPFAGSVRTIRKAATTAGRRLVTAEIDETNNKIRLLEKDTRQARDKILKSVGVDSVDALVQKALDEGIYGKAATAIRDGWKKLGMTYDLKQRVLGEAPPRDPRTAIEAIQNEEIAGRVSEHMTSLNHYLAEIHSGLFASSKNPAMAILRNLAGESRMINLAHQNYMQSMVHALHHLKINEDLGRTMMRAAEGDQKAYEELAPEAKSVVDGWALIRNALREQSAETKYSKRFWPNWVPRLDQEIQGLKKKGGRPSGADILARQKQKARSISMQVDPETGHLFQGQQFETVQETNQAIRASRAQLVAHLLNPEQKLNAAMKNDVEAKEIRRLLDEGNADEAKSRAEKLASDRYHLKDENFFRNVGKAAGYQARSILTQRALNELYETIIRTKHPSGGDDTRRAVEKLSGKDPKQAQELSDRGYVHMPDARFEGFMVDGEFAKTLGRYLDHMQNNRLTSSGAFNTAANIERTLVRFIMYSPAMHGLNIAGRMGVALFNHPLELPAYLKRGKAIMPWQMDEASYELRREAYQSGVMPQRHGQNWQDNFADIQQNALGDLEDNLPQEINSMNSKSGKLKSLLENRPHPYRTLEDGFWAQVHDFGVWMYHVEKSAALKDGKTELQARLWAAERANTWMGMVRPEDTNPLIQQLSRLVLFAPNWWRTQFQLMAPIYRRTGLFPNQEMADYALKSGLKTTAASFGFQKVSGNLINYVFSGHLQSENHQGNQDRIQLSGNTGAGRAYIALMRDMGIFSNNPADPNYVDDNGVNPRTGAVATMENPFARQQLALETAMGEESGQSGHPITPDLKVGPFDMQVNLPGAPSDVMDGLSKFAAARLSPILENTAALANVDLYNTLTQRQMRSIDPTSDPLRPTPDSVLAAAMYLAPGASQWAQQMQKNPDPNQNISVGPFGTVVHKGPQSIGPATKDALSRLVLGLIGINPPYPSAQKTRGEQISDQDYLNAQKAQQKYDSEMRRLSSEALSGQITPYRWRYEYQQLAQQHATQMEAYYNNSPQYVNGADGLINDWEKLYSKATNADGSVNQTQLAQLQAQFRQDHTPQQMQTLNSALRKNDFKYPMLALYHHSLDIFDRWQERWALQTGVDIGKLRGEVDEYNQLYGNSIAQHQYLAQHRELLMYRAALKSQFDQSIDGLTYSLFHGNYMTASRILASRHITLQQLEENAIQQEQQQQ